MNGPEPGPDETKPSFQVVVFDAVQPTLTARECRWNTADAETGKTAVIRWGESKAVSLAQRQPGYFTLKLIKSLAQRAQSKAHGAHRADKVFGSVCSVRASARSMKNNFFRKV